ncbi:NADH dehydrogenase subunit 6 [Iris pallida]|uniref:NADH dehydrogenase subunit 6 (Plastid) n=1 Tax=Iris pallida TaxID=29817 RepID=A0AAX6HWY5_IRIPA|nr:NADH dehydrogenase subunit 6 [Iris pallida]
MVYQNLQNQYIFKYVHEKGPGGFDFLFNNMLTRVTHINSNCPTNGQFSYYK